MRAKTVSQCFGWIILGISLSGVNYCRESYTIGAQSSVATATPTPSTTPTPTPTSSGTTATPTSSRTATPTPAGATQTPTPGTSAAHLLFRDLAGLSAKSNDTGASSHGGSASSGAAKKATDGNWLGKIYNDEEVPGASLDSDGDGYTDKLEIDMGSDPHDPKSIPSVAPKTRLLTRLNTELADGNKWLLDSDGDGCSDGAEIASGSDPYDAHSKPSPDMDGDCLSDPLEAHLGTDMTKADTDGDGLRDDLEMAIGSNPLENDSDRDGILDGKEYELGSDPTIPESQVK